MKKLQVFLTINIKKVFLQTVWRKTSMMSVEIVRNR